MKILYGVVGEGMGHATRSHVVLNHLEKEHEVTIVASGKANEYLRKFHPNVVEIGGYGFAFDNGSVDYRGTFKKLIQDIMDKGPRNLREFVKMSFSDKPDAVVSDFESFAYAYGKVHNIPVVSIDNMQVLSRCKLDIGIPDEMRKDYLLAKNVVKAKLPSCHHYMVTSFFFPKIVKKNTSLFPPILREDILRARPKKGKHVLVYRSSESDPNLMDVLSGVDEDFVVYGFTGGQGHNGGRSRDNVLCKDFSETGFVEDLASAKAVISSAGFSLMGEAIHLGKPYFALPIKKQFEQYLNGAYMESLGYGISRPSLERDELTGFLGSIDQYLGALETFPREDNTRLLGSLDQILGAL